jgi:hypothetical protein
MMAPEDAVGKVCRRKAMMKFARTLAVKGEVAPATAGNVSKKDQTKDSYVKCSTPCSSLPFV